MMQDMGRSVELFATNNRYKRKSCGFTSKNGSTVVASTGTPYFCLLIHDIIDGKEYDFR
jgi:hypothetical protein